MGISTYSGTVSETKTYELPVALSGVKFSFEQTGDNTTIKIEGQPDIKLNSLQLSDLKELIAEL